MYQIASYIAQGLRKGFDNANEGKQAFGQQMNQGVHGNGAMQYGQAPALDTQNQGYFSKTMTDIAMPGMSSEIENNSPLAPFMKSEKQFAAPVGTNAMGATAQGMTVEDFKKLLFGNGG